MVATGYSTLKRTSALGIVMTVALAGCTSVEYTPQHQLAATQKTAPAIKASVTEAGYAAPAAGAVAACATTGVMATEAPATGSSDTTTVLPCSSDR